MNCLHLDEDLPPVVVLHQEARLVMEDLLAQTIGDAQRLDLERDSPPLTFRTPPI